MCAHDQIEVFKELDGTRRVKSQHDLATQQSIQEMMSLTWRRGGRLGITR